MYFYTLQETDVMVCVRACECVCWRGAVWVPHTLQVNKGCSSSSSSRRGHPHYPEVATIVIATTAAHMAAWTGPLSHTHNSTVLP